MKCVIGEGITVDVIKDDLSCVDIIKQILSAVGREVWFCFLYSKIFINCMSLSLPHIFFSFNDSLFIYC